MVSSYSLLATTSLVAPSNHITDDSLATDLLATTSLIVL